MIKTGQQFYIVRQSIFLHKRIVAVILVSSAEILKEQVRIRYITRKNILITGSLYGVKKYFNSYVIRVTAGINGK